MDCLACERIEQIKHGSNRYFVAELKASYAVLADDQRYVGHSILLLKDHQEHLHKLETEQQSLLSEDLMLAANAVVDVFDPVRINYECLGNGLPHIHWHVIPRYNWDPDPVRPIWVRPKKERAVGVESETLKRMVEDLRRALATR